MKLLLMKYGAICLAVLLFASCDEPNVEADFRNEMRELVINVSQKGEQLRPGFIVVPQNGLDLLTEQTGAIGAAQTAYINAIDGCGQEELFYGYDNRNNFLSENYEEQKVWLAECRFARDHNLSVLVTDYCSAPDLVADSYLRNDNEGFVSFAAESRELDLIPVTAHNQNSANVDSLSQARNFLYCISPATDTKEEFISLLEDAPHDVLIIDLFVNDEQLTAADLARMQTKPQGGNRIVLCYMSIGQAESYRWYWQPFWNATPPEFLLQEDPSWTDNYYVRYWNPVWQNILIGPGDSYLGRVCDSGFDGVYLDLVNAFEYFEE